MDKVDLIIPAKEERKNIIILLNSLINKKFINKIIVVLDKNKDKEIFKHKKVTIINQVTKGYGAAIKSGFKFSNAKYACIFNADGSFNINDLPKMYNLIKKKNDFVFASRYLVNGGSEDDTLLTWFGNKVFTLLGKTLLNIKLSDILYTYVLCDRKKFLNLKIKSNDFRLCIELPFRINYLNYNYCSFPSYEYKRQYGKKNVNEFKDGFLILLEIFKCYSKKIKTK